MTFEEKQIISRQISKIQNRLDQVTKHCPGNNLISNDDLDAIRYAVKELKLLVTIELSGYNPDLKKFVTIQ